MPVPYSPALGAVICARIARGETVRAICKGRGMPSHATMYHWLARHPDFAERFARAKAAQLETGMRTRGRPTNYSPAVAATICERVMFGQTTGRICDSPGMPSRKTLFRWLTLSKDFAARYARAKEIQAHLLADEILDIADDPALEPAVKRIRIDARKGLFEMLKPRKYKGRAALEREGFRK